MPWQRIQPSNVGGGRKAVALTAHVNNTGQFTMSHGVALMLGTPARVLVEIDVEALAIRITPTTPDMKGAFTLSGGGNASYRFSMRDAAGRYPELIGSYTPRKQAGAVVFTKKVNDDE